MIIIDGSFGEGGGQILRSSLALSLVTGRGFRIENIRAARKKSGLLRQHLTAANAAARIGKAVVKGNYIGSDSLYFEPKTICGGKYEFKIGTAGSTMLVLQAVLPALLVAHEKSVLVLEGGTHNMASPPFDFLQKAFLPILERMGAKVDIELERYGFYPAGGGKVLVTVEPNGPLKRIDIPERGGTCAKFARAIVSKLPLVICERELDVLCRKLKWDRLCIKAEQVDNSNGPGNVLMAQIASEHITEVFTAFGRKDLPAERVPKPLINEVQRYLAADVPVGEHLADQLMIPMAMAGGGSYKTVSLSDHSTTNIEVIKKFLDIAIDVEQTGNDVCKVKIG